MYNKNTYDSPHPIDRSIVLLLDAPLCTLFLYIFCLLINKASQRNVKIQIYLYSPVDLFEVYN